MMVTPAKNYKAGEKKRDYDYEARCVRLNLRPEVWEKVAKVRTSLGVGSKVKYRAGKQVVPLGEVLERLIEAGLEKLGGERVWNE